MFLLGILAIVQLLFLPGLIFKLLFKPKGGFFFQLSAVVAISMLVNATIIYVLVHFHIYTQILVLVWIGIEVIALLWLGRASFKLSLDHFGQAVNGTARSVWEKIRALFESERTSAFIKLLRGAVILVIGGLAVSLLFWFFRRLTNNFGSVFTTWDAILAWNSWAQSWAQNTPAVNFSYPQLLPLNLSLTYVLIGSFKISLFAKAVMPIFALLTVLMVFELAVEKKQYGYLFAVVLIYLLYKKFMNDYITDGYADIPVAFMTLTALVPYLRSEDFYQDKKEVILSLLLAAAAAMTKQVGLFVLLILPVLALVNGKNKTRSQFLNLLLWFGVGVVLVLPWYLPVAINALKDFSQSGFSTYIGFSAQVQNSASPFLRVGQAFLHLGKYMGLYLFLLPALFLVKRNFRWLILIFIIPFSILWGIIASYDERNLCITFALVAIVCGLGIETLLEYVWQLLDRVRFGRLGVLWLALLIALPLGYFAWKFNDEKLTKIWTDAQSQIFSPEINAQLYALDRSNPQCGKILTNYPVDFLPDLEGMEINSYFNDYAYYEKYIADPAVCWLLIPNGRDPKIEAEITQKLDDGTYELLFSTTKWVPYRLIKIR